MDFDKEKGKATAQLYDLNTFMSSNGLKFKPLNNYDFGSSSSSSCEGL